MPFRSLLLLLGACEFAAFVNVVMTVAVPSAPVSCCASIRSALPAKVFFLRDPEFNASRATYWSKQEQLISPSCIVTPATTNDVSTAVNVLSAASSCPFAVKSGGHMAHAGASNVQDGVTIDLSRLTRFSLKADRSSITLGSGLRWGQVYAKLAPYGLAVPGGRSSDVGVGGYLLGGGSSYFIGHGFGCDNVRSYEIVLANASVLTVSANSHPGLFRALKGGSSNFGIVTAFEVRTFPLEGIWGGNIYYPAQSTYEQQLQAYHSFASNQDYDINAAVQMSLSFSPSLGRLFVNQPFYALPQINPPALHPFTSIQPQLGSETALSNFTAFSVVNSALSPDGSRQMTWALSFENDLQTLHALYRVFDRSTESIAGIPGVVWSLTLEPLPNLFLQASKRQGENMLNLPSSPRGNAVILCESSFTWADENDTAMIRDTGLKLLDDIVTSSKRLGTYVEWVDLNHADVSQDPITSYGSANKAFLRSISRTYDPTQIFQRMVPGGFKVFL